MSLKGLRSILAATSILLIASAAPAFAAEETVTFNVDGMKVVGTLNIPEGAKRPAVVLLLHSFGGSRDEIIIPAVKEGIFARAARKWAERGIASLRIDYRYNGDSDGAFPNSTLDAHVADGLAALDYLAASGKVDPGRMSIVGWSMGGAVASAVAGRTKRPVYAVALWNPAVTLGTSFPLLLGAEPIKAALTKGSPVEIPMPTGGALNLKSGFFVSALTIVPAAELVSYKGPLLVAVGTKEEIVFPQPAIGQSLLAYHQGPEKLISRPMNHYLNIFESEKQVDEIIDLTGTFIADPFE